MSRFLLRVVLLLSALALIVALPGATRAATITQILPTGAAAR